MHRGVGRCTRCYERLEDAPSGAVEELWNANFLGRRIVRSHEERIPRFRIKCEELTGQTDDFADRLPRLKDIFVDQQSEIGRLASEIDMLSVTTTMELIVRLDQWAGSSGIECEGTTFSVTTEWTAGYDFAPDRSKIDRK